MSDIKKHPLQKNKKGISTKKKIIILIAVLLTVLVATSVSVFAYQVYLENTQDPQIPKECENQTGIGCESRITIDKPIIYLYPVKTENVDVRLKLNGEMISTYPSYDNNFGGWQVTASPDGSLINKADGKQYSYLFWEGNPDTDYSNFSEGFVVKGTDTKDFLQSTLAKIGLTPKEYNEMIVYWLPKMENNKYNLIRFAGKDYTDNAKLTISPKPDSVLRVFMVFKALDKYEKIPIQQVNPFTRSGFTVVEWGGTEVN